MTFILTLEGNGAQRGKAHGEQARDMIIQAAERWWADVGAGCEDLVDALGSFRATGSRLEPGLVAEVDGVARSSGVDSRTVWALNMLDEDWWMRDHLAARRGVGALSKSDIRLDTLRRRLADAASTIGLPEASAILGDAPLCGGDDGDTGFTFYSVVMELSGDPVLHLTDGPASQHPYTSFGFGGGGN